MISVNINNIKFKVPQFLTIFQACDFLGISIPHFCYHDKLSIAGNCRMCLIEENKSLKPLASCAVNINENMKIFTNTELVKKSREGVLEFLLANHPLDCPICDQGGECDLQDQSIIFGGDRGRFYEIKRSVEDKDCGPLIKTVMNRCIHCTRCVRFSQEVAGNSSLGTTGRGSSMEIGFYVESFINSELSGNVIDLCPVGALTSKPYAFTARSWELRHYEYIDFFDSLGSNIRIDLRGSDILRIVPRQNELINMQWISDKIRFVYDGLNKQRITKPLIRIMIIFKMTSLISVSWLKIIFYIQTFFKKLLNNIILKKKKFLNIKPFFGEFNDLISLIFFKDFFSSLGTSNFHNSFFDNSNYVDPNLHLLSSNKNLNFVKNSDCILLLGCNPRLESPIFNIWLRKSYLSGNTSIYNLGFNFLSNFFIKFLGNNLINSLKILEGRHWICNKLILSSRPLIIFGDNFSQSFKSSYSIFIKNFDKFLSCNLNSPMYFFLYNCMSKRNAIELGFSKGVHSQINNDLNLVPSINYFYNSADIFHNLKFEPKKFRISNLNIFQGSHGTSNLLNYVDIILPQSNFVEKNSVSINNLGLVQKTRSLFTTPISVKHDWKILKLLSISLRIKKGNKFSLKRVKDHLPFLTFKSQNILSDFLFVNNKNFFFNVNMSSFFSNYYLNDHISRSSKVMSLCSNFFYKTWKNF